MTTCKNCGHEIVHEPVSPGGDVSQWVHKRVTQGKVGVRIRNSIECVDPYIEFKPKAEPAEARVTG